MSAGLDIAFFGSSLVSAYWNGAATYYRGIIRYLAKRGHRITFYEPDAFDRQRHRDIPNPSWAKVVTYSAAHELEVQRLLRQARKADLIVKASGVGVFDELLEAGVLELKKPDNMVVFWDVDAPATLDRVQNNLKDQFRPLIKQYDLILTYGGGEPVVAAYKALAARQCVPIYNALDPETHYPVPPIKCYQGDLGFLGNRLPDRESRVEEFFFKAAGLMPPQRFLLGGSGWSDKPMPENVTYLGHIYTADHNAFNCSPLAVLNINRQSMAEFGFSPPTRIFEAAGAAACLITDNWQGIDLFLEPDREILVAGDGEEVAEHVRRLSRDPCQARTIGRRAREKVQSVHTYEVRAQQVEELLGVS